MGTEMYIFGIILLFIIILIIIQFNSLIRARNKVKQSKSSIDVYLTQRFDLIPNLVEVVKASSKHETEVYQKMAELRSSYNNTKNIKVGEDLNNTMNTVLMTAEDNPNLKASEQFIKLQKTLVRLESQLQAARRIYNGDVTLYNTAITNFPSNVVAFLFGFSEEELFTIEEYKRENIDLKV